MSLHGDLLEQAGRLARQEPKKPKQASLRRAVSAAYYALFHLLIDEATRLFLSGVQREALRPRLARAFRHSSMKKVSLALAKGRIPQKLHIGGYAYPLQPELRFVAGAFCDLQDARHDSDYDLAQRFSRGDADALIDVTQKAFDNWRKVRGTPQADTYLTGLLVLNIMQG